MFEIILLIAILILLFSYKNGKIHYVTGALLIIYPFYEIWIQSTCTGECNIRVDLLIIYPLLLAFSIASIIKIVIRKKGKENQKI